MNTTLTRPREQVVPSEQLATEPAVMRQASRARTRADDGDVLVQARGLTKRYGARVSVEQLTMTVRRGEVYGFLGPNGAGKTTTLRMLLGLITPTSGTATVVGRPPGDPAGLARVGALVESPAFYPYLTGRDNLAVLARYAEVPERRIDDVLAVVELADRAGDPFKTYSLGMKQRLGVAAALLKQPELLILDEPTNGLDPEGIADMRDLIRRLGTGRTSVLLSSHLLGEIEQICDRVGIIQGGNLVAEGTVDDLRGAAELIVRADPVVRASQVIERRFGPDRVRLSSGRIHLRADPSLAPDVARELVAAGVDVIELVPRQQTLEEVFLHMTEAA